MFMSPYPTCVTNPGVVVWQVRIDAIPSKGFANGPGWTEKRLWSVRSASDWFWICQVQGLDWLALKWSTSFLLVNSAGPRIPSRPGGSLQQHLRRPSYPAALVQDGAKRQRLQFIFGDSNYASSTGKAVVCFVEHGIVVLRVIPFSLSSDNVEVFFGQSHPITKLAQHSPEDYLHHCVIGI